MSQKGKNVVNKHPDCGVKQKSNTENHYKSVRDKRLIFYFNAVFKDIDDDECQQQRIENDSQLHLP